MAAEYNQLSDGRPDGTQLGINAADKIAFHGVTPVAQISYLSTITASTTLSQVVANFNTLLDALKTRGLIASS